MNSIAGFQFQLLEPGSLKVLSDRCGIMPAHLNGEGAGRVELEVPSDYKGTCAVLRIQVLTGSGVAAAEEMKITVE